MTASTAEKKANSLFPDFSAECFANKASKPSFAFASSPKILQAHCKSDFASFVSQKIASWHEEDANYNVPQSLDDWLKNWDFATCDANVYAHGFHQYPARFIPQLARKLLKTFCDENSRVLDIFSGSGTTLLECKYLGLCSSFGIELNPFACFMARTKLQNLDENPPRDAFLQIQSRFFAKNFDFSLGNFKNIDFWHSQKAKNDLSKLLAAILKVEDEKTRNFCLLAFCEISRKCSFLEHGGFKMYRSRTKIAKNFEADVWGEFEKTFARNLRLLHESCAICKNSRTECRVIQGDSRVLHEEIEQNSIDFILTSPPYGDSRTTVAYGQYSRLPWQWLSQSDGIISLDRELLGGNSKNFDGDILQKSATLQAQFENVRLADEKRARDVLSFYSDLQKTLECAKRYLKNGAFFVLVTGNRTVKKEVLRTDLIISELGAQIGLSTETILSRRICNKRMASRNSPTNEKGKTESTMLTENIIVLRKE